MAKFIQRTKFHEIARLARAIGRPLCIIDTETTGLLRDTVVGIVEFAYLRINPDGTQQSGEALINPGIPIPWEATNIHGIKDVHVKGKGSAVIIMPLLTGLFNECVIAGYNLRLFDLPVINKNAARYKRKLALPKYQLDVRDIHIAHSKSTRGTLLDVAAKYGVFPDVAHRAMGDVLTTASLLVSMIKQHGDRFVMDRLIEPKVTKKAAKPRQAPESNGTRHAIRRAIMSHVETFGGIDGDGYLLIQQQVDASEAMVKSIVAGLFSQKILSNKQVSNPTIQSIIEQHIDEALSRVPNASTRQQIKAALDDVSGLDVDVVQLRVALFNWVTSDQRQSDGDGLRP